MKKLFLIIGAIFVVLLVAVISVPLFVDVDRYRPAITAEANKRMNGQLELGRLKLSLWGAIKIHAESIVVKVNGFSEPMLDTRKFHLEIPFLSVLSGRPQIIAVLDAPKISIRKEANGKMNILELMKVPGASADAGFSAETEQAAASDQVSNISGAPKKSAPAAKENTAPVSAAAVPAATPAAPSAPSEPTKVPAIVAGARIGLTINKGEVHYVDVLGKSQYDVNGLDLQARNLGLGSTMDISLTAPLKGAMPDLTFEGPVSLDANITPVLVNNMVKSVKGTLSVDATKLAVDMKGGLFHKTPSMTFTAKTEVDGNEHETLVKSLEVRFHNFQIHGKGRATAEPVTAQVEITTEPFRLNDIQEFVPMVMAYQLKGLGGLNVKLDYNPNGIRANGDVSVKDGSFFMKDVLKAPMDFQLQGGFSENTFNLVRASISAPDSDMQLVGDVKNFLAPQFAFSLSGKSFNVDKTLVLPTAGAPAKTAMISLITEAFAEEKKPSEINPMLSLAKNPVMMNASGTLVGKLNRVVAYGANFDDVNVKSRLQNMVLYVPEAHLKIFGGAVKANAEADLKAPALTYKTSGSMAGVSAKEAFASYFPKYKNTLEAATDATWNLTGATYPPAIRMRSVKGTAKLLARDGAIKSVDFQGTINSATDKVPFLKGKKVQIDEGFKTFTADLRFDGGNIYVEPMEMQPRGKGFVIKGKSTIAESLEQDSYLDLFDPQGILPKEFQAPGKPAIALHLTGPLTGPRTDYEYTVKKLAGTAGKNLVKDQAAKALGKFLGGDATKTDGQSGKQDALKDAADKLKKKFFKF